MLRKSHQKNPGHGAMNGPAMRSPPRWLFFGENTASCSKHEMTCLAFHHHFQSWKLFHLYIDSPISNPKLGMFLQALSNLNPNQHLQNYTYNQQCLAQKISWNSKMVGEKYESKISNGSKMGNHGEPKSMDDLCFKQPPTPNVSRDSPRGQRPANL